jgi:2-polyprenyl-6-hydroxyphenyl methylase/3-demethylubiquinone-9 3-methyltransferase
MAATHPHPAPSASRTWRLGRFLPAALKAKISPSLVVAVPKTGWNHEYASGAWDYLTTIQEVSRYSVIAGLCRQVAPKARVLDVGCGQGVLAGWLAGAGISRYVGIDVSEVAIEQARRMNPDHEFAVADASTFESSQQFDVIVFNEILYYLKKPEEDALRFARSLAPGGVLIVSIWHHVDGLRTWARLKPAFEELDRVRLTHCPTGLRWELAILRPR